MSGPILISHGPYFAFILGILQIICWACLTSWCKAVSESQSFPRYLASHEVRLWEWSEPTLLSCLYEHGMSTCPWFWAMALAPCLVWGLYAIEAEFLVASSCCQTPCQTSHSISPTHHLLSCFTSKSCFGVWLCSLNFCYKIYLEVLAGWLTQSMNLRHPLEQNHCQTFSNVFSIHRR